MVTATPARAPFRAAHLDAAALGYAARVAGGVDAVALTHLDTARAQAGTLTIGRAYAADGRLVSAIEPGPPRDLGYQEALTTMLRGARPLDDPAGPLAAGGLAGRGGGDRGCPVTIRSHGRGRAAKQTAGRWARPLTGLPR